MEEPSEILRRKTPSSLDKHCGVFIKRAPFMLPATVEREGNVDVSPKGDPQGFVKITDEYTLAIRERSPKIAIVVRVEEAFFHCSKCMIRSKLWQQEHWPDLEGLPRLAQTMVDAGRLELSETDLHTLVVNDEKERLY